MKQGDTDEDMCASLPPKLLLDIFRRLELTAVIRCTATCKTWRRTIISNAASCLRPRPDRFHPDLFLGFIYGPRRGNLTMQSTPGPLASSVVNAASDTMDSFVPAVAAGGVDLALYNKPLASRDGLLLLGGTAVDDLCLCNPLTGDCTFLAAASFGACEYSQYTLVTGYDDLSPSDGSAAEILAVEKATEILGRAMTYQLFSSTSGGGPGAWGPVKRCLESRMTYIYQDSDVVCCDAVYQLALAYNDAGYLRVHVLAVDVRDGRAWATELPEQCQLSLGTGFLLTLATSRDGNLSVLRSMPVHRIQVWALAGGGQWTPRQTIHVKNMPPRCRDNEAVEVKAFCPRRGCIIGVVYAVRVLINVETGMACAIKEGDGADFVYNRPYEMDWSTYISRMTEF